jgi:hypothetical protein
VSEVADKALLLHRALERAGLPHALGGALALGWCTRDPRGTSDIDVNIFVPTSAVTQVIEALPPEVVATEENIGQLRRDGQSRLLWDDTPVDVFLTTDEFHTEVMRRVSLEPFLGELVPFLSCSDLAVFKAFFDRRRDWADIEDMLVAHTIDIGAVAAVIERFLGADDARIAKLQEIQDEVLGR